MPVSAFTNKTRFLLPLLVLSLACTSAFAQVTYTGAASTENFTSQNTLVTSASRSFSFSITAGTKVGSIGVLTTGIASLDFASASGTTCAATTYASTATCTVNVTFTPLASGARNGAVVFFSKSGNSGNILGSVPVYGVGVGAQIAYGPATVSAVDRTMHGILGLSNPGALTTDAFGNIYVLDASASPVTYRLVKLSPTGSSLATYQPVVNGLALYLPSCVAVDGAGSLYIGDFGRRIVKIPAGGGSTTAIAPVVNGIAMNYPSGLAIDGAGNMFIADYINNRIIEISATGAASAVTPTAGGVALNSPHGLALDGLGNLLITDSGNNRVVKMPIAGGTSTAITAVANGLALRNPVGVALDGAGDLFIADNVNHRIVDVPASGGAPIAIDPTLYYAGVGEVYATNVDGAGNLFMTQGGLAAGMNIVEEISYGVNPTLNFATPTIVGQTDSTDGMQTVQIFNIGNRALTLTNLTVPADFFAAGSSSDGCLSNTVLNPGQMCELGIEFVPQNAGALSENIVLTDNNLSTSGAQQSIQLTGTAELLSAIVSPAPGGALPGTSATFTWTAVNGATAYYLSLGSTGPGSTNLFQTGKRTVTSWSATGLPTNGSPVYARLTTYFGNLQMYKDYVFTAATAAAMTTPAPSTRLSGSTATFTWSASPQAIGYSLWLGSTAAGSNNLYISPTLTGTSVNVTKLPTGGSTIYARLYTNYSGSQKYVDYVYTAH